MDLNELEEPIFHNYIVKPKKITSKFHLHPPNLKIKSTNNTNIVKIVSNKKNEVMYISRANIPHEFKSKVTHFKKHLSIVSFKPESLISFGKAKRSELEKSEDIE